MKLLICLLIGFFSLASQAQIELGVAGGMRSTQAETDFNQASVTSQVGMQAGLISYFPVLPIWGVRTGFFYTQRNVDIGPLDPSQGSVEIRFSYLDIPVTPMIRFNEYAGIFGGPVISFNQSREATCTRSSTCSAEDVSSVILPWQIGIQAKFFYQFGAEAYYEFIPGGIAKHVSDMRSVGGNLIFYFE